MKVSNKKFQGKIPVLDSSLLEENCSCIRVNRTTVDLIPLTKQTAYFLLPHKRGKINVFLTKPDKWEEKLVDVIIPNGCVAHIFDEHCKFTGVIFDRPKDLLRIIFDKTENDWDLSLLELSNDEKLALNEEIYKVLSE